MPTISEIQPTKAGVEDDFFKKANVQGVGIGRKTVKGQKTDELSIVVFVRKKKDVPAKDRIPKTVKGVKTDVVEREIVLHPRWVPVTDLHPSVDAGNYATLQGGISIGPCRSVYIGGADVACQGVPAAGWYVFVGTLGAMVRDNTTNDPMLLSNFHVMCVDDNWTAGDTIAQPSLVDGGACPADVVATLARASLGGQVDCAVARRTARTSQCRIVDIGWVDGTATAVLNQHVRKRGRTTELTHGIVDTLSLTVDIDYCNGLGVVRLTNQIGIDVDTSQSAVFGQGGDSGSVVVDDSRRVVGLYFAGDATGTYGVANPIAPVLTALDVSMCIGGVKKFEKELPKEILKDIVKEPKEFKERIKEYIKEKDLIKDYIKEKERFKDYKEPKEIYEVKEFVEGGKELVEGGKEFVEGGKNLVDSGKGFMEGDIPGKPGEGGIIDRIRSLEGAVSQLSHFIQAAHRPDLSRGALAGEPDQGLQGTKGQMEKQAQDAKQAKDVKDVEKLRES